MKDVLRYATYGMAPADGSDGPLFNQWTDFVGTEVQIRCAVDYTMGWTVVSAVNGRRASPADDAPRALVAKALLAYGDQ